MKLYHVSPATNDDSIRVHGLLISKSQTETPEVWAVSRDMVMWAVAYCRKRHGVERVTVWIVKTKAKQFHKRMNRLYRSETDALPEQLIGKLVVTATGVVYA